MELEFVLVADAANISREGKLNIAGEFNTIFSEKVPVVWPSMAIVSRLNAHVTEGSEHRATLVINDEDGNELVRSPDFPIRFGSQGSGRRLRAAIVINLGGTRFPDYGDYEVNLLVDGRHMGTAPIYVSPPLDSGQP